MAVVSTNMAASRSLPVVVILGATGTGKSKLAIEIGHILSGEIISTDSMQVYKGLDIVTNKVTQEEQKACPHHMINLINPSVTNFTVRNFQKMVLPIIDGLLQKNKMPIIVGGTNYYIESLLWNFLITQEDIKQLKKCDEPSRKRQCIDEKSLKTGQNINYSLSASDNKDYTSPYGLFDDELKVDTASRDHQSGAHAVVSSSRSGTGNQTSSDAAIRESDSDNDDGIPNVSKKTEKYADVETKDLHAKLAEVDAEMAKTVHPHHRRKILRALQVFEDHGVTMTDVLREQHKETGDGALSGSFRYPRTCVLWIQCDQKVLDDRLDKRVDVMLENGLLQELSAFHADWKARSNDTNSGIFQSIGFKEFTDFLVLSEEEKASDKGRELQAQGIKDLKTVTRRYARKQIRWIQNRFLKRPGLAVPSVYAVDSTDVSRWEDDVSIPALRVVQAVIEDRLSDLMPLSCESVQQNQCVHHVCEVCNNQLFIRQIDWEAHLNGNRHKKRVAKKKKMEKINDNQKSRNAGDEQKRHEEEQKTEETVGT